MDLNEKYKQLDNVIQFINEKCIAIPNSEAKRNNHLLKAVNEIIKVMKENVLFDSLFERIFHGGSYYDGLKVGKPSEYDLDCVLRLPKLIQTTIDESDLHGFVHINLSNLDTLEKQPEWYKYKDLKTFLHSNALSTFEVLKWFHSLVIKALNSFRENRDVKNPAIIKYEIDGKMYSAKATASTSGPAQTLNFNVEFDGTKFDVDIDLVVCFIFTKDRWPKKHFRQNPSKDKTEFLAVPKTPKNVNLASPTYWRLSFQEQEREILKDSYHLKPTLRLFKKLRDQHNHKIASYFIKTVFLWETTNKDNSYWKGSLGALFMTTLSRYIEYIEERNIPYYWNEHFNLIQDLDESTCTSIAGNLKNIQKNIERSLDNDPKIIVKYFLSQDECQDVDKIIVGRKYRKPKADCKINLKSTLMEDAGPTEERKDVRKFNLKKLGYSCNIRHKLEQKVNINSVSNSSSDAEQSQKSINDDSADIPQDDSEPQVKSDSYLDKFESITSMLEEHMKLMDMRYNQLLDQMKMLNGRVESLESITCGNLEKNLTHKIDLLLGKVSNVENELNKLLQENKRNGDDDFFNSLLGSVDKLHLTTNYPK